MIPMMMNNQPRRTRHGALYNAEALREAVQKRGMTVRAISRKLGTGDQEIMRWLKPRPGQRMHWNSMNRLRKALNLTEEEVRAIWEVSAADEQSDG